MSQPLGISMMFALGAAILAAQSAPGTIQATGSASLSVKPDQATLQVSITTQGATAQEAADKNASQATAVINALNLLLGKSGTVQTVGYSVYARYSTTPGQVEVLVGYTATNTVKAITADLSLVGRLIDTATQSGASSIGGLSFGLQDQEPSKQQALSAAAKQAMAHATAIASGLGGKTGAVVSAQEGSSVSSYDVASGIATSTPTPVQTGTVTVTATVTITVQLLQ